MPVRLVLFLTIAQCTAKPTPTPPPAGDPLANGGMRCGLGTIALNGTCVATSTSSCGPGTVLVHGACVPSSDVCAPGSVFDVDTQKCVLVFSQPPPAPSPACTGDGCAQSVSECGAGTALVDGACVAVARVQIIHDAAAPGLAELDVYVNGALSTTLAFRSATPYFVAPPAEAATPIELVPRGEAPSGHPAIVLVGDATLPFVPGHDYAIVAANDDNGTPAVNDDADRLTLYVFAGMAKPSGGLAVQVFHGGADLAQVDAGAATPTAWKRDQLGAGIAFGEALTAYQMPQATWLSFARGTGGALGFYALSALSSQATEVIALSGYALPPPGVDAGRELAVVAYPSNGGAGHGLAQAAARVQVINETGAPATVLASGAVVASGLAPRHATTVELLPPAFLCEATGVTRGVAFDPGERAAIVISSATGAGELVQVRRVDAPSSDVNMALRFVHASAAFPAIDLSADATNKDGMRLAQAIAPNGVAATVQVRAQSYDLFVFPAGQTTPAQRYLGADFSAFDGRALVLTLSGAALVAYDEDGGATVFPPN
jgi:hypothetical protein